MMLTTIINGALGLAAVITACFITTDIDKQIMNGDPNYPYVELFAEALDSVGGAVTLAVGVIVIQISMSAIPPLALGPEMLTSKGMTINAVAAASRQGWAFARDG